jgi:Tol biopolymer transport system component
LSGSRWPEIERVCQAALERPPELRAAFLAEACGGDDMLRREVDSLLAQASAANSFIETPALDVALDEDDAPAGLVVGQRLGTYHVVSCLGAGGMGEVYRARDTELGRDVALKILPPTLLRDPERLARFEREARVLAALNHPNVGAIYGLANDAGVRALVLELVEGETLAEKLASSWSGALPLTEALPIARQIADALEAAHEKGIIHRDLKPANVVITHARVVKVLDFGLAKLAAVDGAPSALTPSQSPTITASGTRGGLLLGTARYMSPEQARGQAVDKRTDIWAFGCVLFEMLTGHAAFPGATVTDTLAAIVDRDPEWARLPAALHPNVRTMLRRCLEKDRKQRLPDIGAARLEIEDAQSQLAGNAVVATAPRHKWFAWAVPGLVFLAGAIALAVGWAITRVREAPNTDPTQTRFQIGVPEDVTFPTGSAPGGVIGGFAVSPDGRHLAFTGTSSDKVTRIWLRPMDALEARPLAGTEGAKSDPFWSPDGRYLAFNAGEKLKKIDVAGGLAQVICDVQGNLLGGSWGRDDVILFGDSFDVIRRVSAAGGVPAPVTELDSSRQEFGHGDPVFLADGRHFLFNRASRTRAWAFYVGSLDATPKEQGATSLVETRFHLGYVPPSGAGPGYVLFRREGTLLAQPFDERTRTLSGEPIAVAEGLGSSIMHGFFSASINGVLVYRTGLATENSQLMWIDRQGHVISQVGDPAFYRFVRLSPNGSSVATTRMEWGNLLQDLWLVDIASGASTRFTFGGNQNGPVWSPDSRRLAFTKEVGLPNESWRIVVKPANSAGDETTLLEPGKDQGPDDWSRDGRFLLYERNDPKTHFDIWVQPLPGGTAVPFLASPFNEGDARFSPDGRWVAYSSDESGQFEVYVREFTPNGAGGKLLVSKGGGLKPRWRGDGKEVFYHGSDGTVMSVDVSTVRGEFHAATPKPLFKVVNADRWDVTSDGTRFLVAVPVEQDSRTPFTVVLNWQAGLKK